MRDPVQQGRCHLYFPKDGHPFPKLQICGDDDAGFLIELADEVEQQRPAGFGEFEALHEVTNRPVDGLSAQTGGAQMYPSSSIITRSNWVSCGSGPCDAND